VQDRFHFLPAESFGKNFPALGRIDVQRGVVFEQIIQQQVAIEVPQRRELSRHRAPVHLIGEQLLQKLADIFTLPGQKRAFAAFQELGKLQQITEVGTDGKAR